MLSVFVSIRRLVCHKLFTKLIELILEFFRLIYSPIVSNQSIG